MGSDGLTRCSSRNRDDLDSSVMVVMLMPVRMAAMPLFRAAAIGTRFGFERCFSRFHRQPQTPQHVVQHVIVQEADIVRLDLDGNMTVAQMVAGSGQQVRIVAADNGECFVARL